MKSLFQRELGAEGLLGLQLPGPPPGLNIADHGYDLSVRKGFAKRWHKQPPIPDQLLELSVGVVPGVLAGVQGRRGGNPGVPCAILAMAGRTVFNIDLRAKCQIVFPVG